MKILFLFKLENWMAPIGICQLSAVAKEAGHEVELCEMNTEHYWDAIHRVGPDVIAVSTMTGEAKHYNKAVAEIKSHMPHIFCIAGGIHPTAYPQMLNETSFDAICMGEGEGAFVDLLKRLDKTNGLFLSGGISNMVPQHVWKNHELYANIRPLVSDLDSLPFPDFDLVYERTPLGAAPLKAFMTGRGCPFSCTYCWNEKSKDLYRHHGGKHVRKNSVDYVLENIKRVQAKWPMSCVKFYDDMLIWKADDWAIEFSERYRKEIGLPFFAFCRAEMANEDVIRLLAEAGCQTLSMSIECGNEQIRREVLNRRMTNDQIIEAHLLAKKHGIMTFTNVIVGLPGTTHKHNIESLDLARKCQVKWIEYLVYQPYPGTELGDYCVVKGYYEPDYDSMHSGYHHESRLTCFTKAEKQQQLALTTLGVVATVKPRWRNLIVKHFLSRKTGKLAILLYFLVKMPVVRQLYPTETTWWNSMRIYIRSLKQELFKHTEE